MPTTLYHHYKNKPYKFLGIAKHSETLQDMVVYETRYENELATLWVRPQDIFESSLEMDGKKIPRFQKAVFQFQELTEVSPQTLARLGVLNEVIFGEWSSALFLDKLKKHPRFLLLLATFEDKLVGFKIGYHLDDVTFYSWKGGVLPEFRGVGVASELALNLYQWCRTQRYKKVRTKTQNQFREMFILNLKHGFEVVGTEESPTKGLKIILEKRLT